MAFTPHQVYPFLDFHNLRIGILTFVINSVAGVDITRCISYNTFATKFLPLSTIPDTEVWNYFDIDLCPQEIYFHSTNTWGLVDKIIHHADQFSVLITDITTIKQRELDALHQMSVLQSLNKDLENFAFIAAHDLKEPARKVVSFGERFLAKTKEIAYTDEQRLFLNKMIEGASRMYHLIDYILDFSKQTKKLENFKKVDLNTVLQEVLHELQLTIKQEDAIVSISSLPSVKGDETQLIGVFKNLLSNALKFHKPQMHPVIQVDTYEPTEEILQTANLSKEETYKGVVIRDNGIGFDENEKDRLFKMFGRLRGRSEYKGVGLGLAICKRLIENHGGAIWAEGQPNEGAQFIILLPKA